MPRRLFCFSIAVSFSNRVFIALIDVGSTQQIIESANPVPSVTVAFEHDPVCWLANRRGTLRLPDAESLS
jgi:hypothetical protein